MRRGLSFPEEADAHLVARNVSPRQRRRMGNESQINLSALPATSALILPAHLGASPCSIWDSLMSGPERQTEGIPT